MPLTHLLADSFKNILPCPAEVWWKEETPSTVTLCRCVHRDTDHRGRHAPDTTRERPASGEWQETSEEVLLYHQYKAVW